MTAPVDVKHILYVDDDADDIHIFETVLHEVCPNIKLTTEAKSTRIISLLESSPAPDVIILDMNMPAESGLECLKRIKSFNKFHDIPVIIYSTSKTVLSVRDCMACGATHFAQKGNSVDEVRQFIQDVCGGRLRP